MWNKTSQVTILADNEKIIGMRARRDDNYYYYNDFQFVIGRKDWFYIKLTLTQNWLLIEMAYFNIPDNELGESILTNPLNVTL